MIQDFFFFFLDLISVANLALDLGFNHFSF